MDFLPTPELLALVRGRASGVGSSQLCEDMFGYQKSSRIMKGKKKYRRPEKAMGICIARSVPDKLHKYKALEVETPLKAQSIRLPRTAFESCGEHFDNPLDFKRIVSTSSKAPWYSPGAGGFSQAHADLALISDDFAAGQWAQVSQAWLGRMCSHSHRLLLRTKSSENDGAWMFALCNWGDSAVAVWPALKVPVPGHSRQVCYEFDLRVGKPCLMSLVSLDGVEAMSFTWRGPAWTYATFPRSFGSLIAGVRAFADCLPSPLHEVAARHCFWRLEKTFIQRLCAHLDIQLDTGGSLLSVCVVAIMGILSCPEDEALGFVAQRMAVEAANVWHDEVLDIEEAAQCLDRHDQDEVGRQQQAARSAKEEANDFRNEYRQRRSAVASGASSGGGGRGGKKKKKEAAESDPLRPRKLPPISTISHRDAAAWAPPGASIWRGLKEGNWQGHLPPFRRCSRSWGRYTESGALQLILATLWEEWCTLNGVSHKDCPVKGLLAEVDMPQEGSRSSSSTQQP